MKGAEMSTHKNKVTGSMVKWCEEIRRDFSDLKNELTFETEHVVAMVESKNDKNCCGNEGQKSGQFSVETGSVPVTDEHSNVSVNYYLKQANEKLMSVNDLLERQYREVAEYNKLLERELSCVQQEMKIEKAVRKGLFSAIEDELVILDEKLKIVYQNKTIIEQYGDCAGKKWEVLFDSSFRDLRKEELERFMRGMEKTTLRLKNDKDEQFEVFILPIRNLDLNLYTLVMKKKLAKIDKTADSTAVQFEQRRNKNLTLSDVTKMENSKKGSVTHKIRTPLNSILTSARIIQKYNREKPDEVEKFSKIVVDETNRILDLIKELPEN